MHPDGVNSFEVRLPRACILCMWARAPGVTIPCLPITGLLLRCTLPREPERPLAQAGLLPRRPAPDPCCRPPRRGHFVCADPRGRVQGKPPITLFPQICAPPSLGVRAPPPHTADSWLREQVQVSNPDPEIIIDVLLNVQYSGEPFPSLNDFLHHCVHGFFNQEVRRVITRSILLRLYLSAYQVSTPAPLARHAVLLWHAVQHLFSLCRLPPG